MKNIFERWWTFLGHRIYLRIVPLEYERTLKEISNLIDDEKSVEANTKIEEAYSRWGCDHELVRLDTLRAFLDGE